MKLNSKAVMATRTLVYCAMFAALMVVLARFLGVMLTEDSRISLETIPVFLAGLFFGPVAGAMVGFAGDFIGCLFSRYGFNPLFCLPPILYGLCGGLCRRMIGKTPSLWRLALAYLVPVALGSVLYQSLALTWMYYKDGPFLEGLILKLSARGIQFAITWVVNVAVCYGLFRLRLFHRAGLWPLPEKKKGSE